MIEEPQIVSKDSNDIKQVGNQFYYNGYRITSMSTLKNNDDKYIVELDYSSKLPKDDIITTGINAAKLITLIKNPVKVITKSEEIKNGLKNLTNKEKVVSSNADEVMKKLGVKNPNIKALDYNLSNGYKASEIKNIAKIGELSKEGNARFLKGNGNDAMNMFKERVANLGSIKKKMAYYKDGTLKGIYYTGYDKFDNKIVYRTYSSTKGSFHTLDLYKGNGKRIIKEIKFRE